MPVAEDAGRYDNEIGMGVIVEPDKDGNYSRSFPGLQLGIKAGGHRIDKSMDQDTSFTMLNPSKRQRGSLAAASSVFNVVSVKNSARLSVNSSYLDKQG